MHKCHLGATEINFLGQTITLRVVKPQKQNVQNILDLGGIQEAGL